MDNRYLIEQYINQISLKNNEAFEKLYNLTSAAIYGFAFSLLNDIHEAEDVMQDSYVNIYKYAHIYNPQGKPMAWIFTITRNLCMLKLNKRKKASNYSIEEIESYFLKDNKDYHYNKLLLKTILEELTGDEKTIIILSANGFKYREIADYLDLNLSTVLSKYHRAVKKIRSNYKEV